NCEFTRELGRERDDREPMMIVQVHLSAPDDRSIARNIHNQMSRQSLGGFGRDKNLFVWPIERLVRRQQDAIMRIIPEDFVVRRSGAMPVARVKDEGIAVVLVGIVRISRNLQIVNSCGAEAVRPYCPKEVAAAGLVVFVTIIDMVVAAFA